MADYIDSFVDTREKRSLLMRLLCWFGWMIVCALALYTASRLIMVNDYAGLFGLLDDERMSFFSDKRPAFYFHFVNHVVGCMESYVVHVCVIVGHSYVFGVCIETYATCGEDVFSIVYAGQQENSGAVGDRSFYDCRVASL